MKCYLRYDNWRMSVMSQKGHSKYLYVVQFLPLKRLGTGFNLYAAWCFPLFCTPPVLYSLSKHCSLIISRVVKCEFLKTRSFCLIHLCVSTSNNCLASSTQYFFIKLNITGKLNFFNVLITTCNQPETASQKSVYKLTIGRGQALPI